MKSQTVPDTLIPPSLLPEIEAAAQEEHRAPSELVGEAVERYLSERRWFPKDEVHAKIAKGLASLRQGKGLDGEAVMAELLAELDAPQRAP
jgi:predicted transcriptional regulator